MELLYILREWVFGEGEELKTFTLDNLLYIQKVMDMTDNSGNGDGFTQFITGLSCDTYADLSCDIMKEIYEPGMDLEHCYNCCMSDLHFQTCYTVYRLWNSRHTEEVALRHWKDSCIFTLEGIIEDIEEE